MTAQLIRFPIVARPIPLLNDPRYRRGVTECLAGVLAAHHGYSIEFAKSEAVRLAAMTLDQLPQNFGEGEAS